MGRCFLILFSGHIQDEFFDGESWQVAVCSFVHFSFLLSTRFVIAEADLELPR